MVVPSLFYRDRMLPTYLRDSTFVVMNGLSESMLAHGLNQSSRRNDIFIYAR